MMKIIAAAYGTVILMYAIIVSGGYLAFGTDVESNILNNLPDGLRQVDLCRMILGVMILLTYPVVGFATRGSLSRACTGTDVLPDWQRWLMAAVLVIIPVTISVMVPNIG